MISETSKQLLLSTYEETARIVDSIQIDVDALRKELDKKETLLNIRITSLGELHKDIQELKIDEGIARESI